LRQIPSFATDQLLLIIEAINDKTRAEILALLITIPEGNGLTASDISRQIKKAIPSTLYQLEILYSAGLITKSMILVKSIGREIKHWIFLHENSHLKLNFDLENLLYEHFLPMHLRKDYLDHLLSIHGILGVKDLITFDRNILSSLFLMINLKDKEKEKRITILTNKKNKYVKSMLISALIDKIRLITIGDGIKIKLISNMFGFDEQLANILIVKIINSQEFSYDEQTEVIHIRLQDEFQHIDQ